MQKKVDNIKSAINESTKNQHKQRALLALISIMNRQQNNFLNCYSLLEIEFEIVLIFFLYFMYVLEREK